MSRVSWVLLSFLVVRQVMRLILRAFLEFRVLWLTCRTGVPFAERLCYNTTMIWSGTTEKREWMGTLRGPREVHCECMEKIG